MDEHHLTPFELMDRVKAAGGHLLPLPDGRIQMNAPAPLPEALVAELRARKAELLAALRLPIPDEWLQGVARLQTMPVPARVPGPWWWQLLRDADEFWPWAGRAAALDWSTNDVFGVLPVKPLERVDGWGLVPALRGAEFVALTATSARLRTRTGTLQSFTRRKLLGAAPIWQLLENSEEMPNDILLPRAPPPSTAADGRGGCGSTLVD